MTQSNSNKTLNHSFLTGINAEYISHLYAEYKRNPYDVAVSWREFFEGLNDEELDILRERHGASWTPKDERVESRSFGSMAQTSAPSQMAGAMPQMVPAMPMMPQQGGYGAPLQNQSTTSNQAVQDSIHAIQMIRAYRMRGHLAADLDPLKLRKMDYHPELDPKTHGFTDADMDRSIRLDGVLGFESATLRQILDRLKQIYCSSIGVEFMHMADPEEKAWLQARIEENGNRTDFTPNGRKAILSRLIAAENFETFLHRKYPGTKRFGLDGLEAMIPATEQIMKKGGQLGLKEIVLGMAHRGRLNVLANVMGKPYKAIFAEFMGLDTMPDGYQGSGDVKYHLGASSDRDFDGNEVHLTLSPNPSHLEAVNPVVIGRARAKQMQKNDVSATEVMPILLHGDAAFAGQGLVAETLMISELPGYRVGGTVHIVTNNQIGFTTRPQYGRSGPYSTDVSKMLSSPIFHVNADDPEAVVHAARIVAEFRQKFKKDIVLDIIGYRRNGHNEGDEPAFTSPLMYQRIAEHPTCATIYAQRLEQDGVIKGDDFDQMKKDFDDELEQAFKDASGYKAELSVFGGEWSGLSTPDTKDDARRGKTSISEEKMHAYKEVITSVPEGFNLNSKLQRLMKAREKMFETGEGFDWATGETLAYASLVDEGHGVRLSGQDCGRGTFSHRHAIMYDQTTEEKYSQLQHVSKDQARFEVHDSPLSEAAVLGFEYGFSCTDPKTLVLWEAQFGDFANGAQVLIDQFISSAEAKWVRMSGLTLLLPHGYEGQGPEHSSARWERFLQMSAEDNWQVVNCTTPANYFHVLRRQQMREFRKPLVVMTPKSLLRHKLCVSKFEEFTGDSSFHRVLWDDAEMQGKLKKPKDIKRVVLCSGKVYYDLYQAREEKGIDDVLILRLEQVYPFPHDALVEELKKYQKADIVWCQEEPENMGCWQFVDRRIEAVLAELKHKGASRPTYVGRMAAASPATGSLSKHKVQQEALINDALELKKNKK